MVYPGRLPIEQKIVFELDVALNELLTHRVGRQEPRTIDDAGQFLHPT